MKQALPLRERLLALEPYVPIFNTTFANMLWASGQTDAAIAIYKSPAAAQPGVGLAMLYASQGRYGEAADLLQSVRSDDAVLSGQLQAAARVLRTSPAAQLRRRSFRSSACPDGYSFMPARPNAFWNTMKAISKSATTPA